MCDNDNNRNFIYRGEHRKGSNKYSEDWRQQPDISLKYRIPLDLQQIHASRHPDYKYCFYRRLGFPMNKTIIHMHMHICMHAHAHTHADTDTCV